MQGYKDNGFITGGSYLITLISWLILFYSLAGNLLLKEKVLKYKANKNKWLKQKVKKLFAYFSFCGLIVLNIVVIENLSELRVQNILDNKPTSITVGTIIEIQNRTGRNGGNSFAIITYKTKDENLNRAIFNYKNSYSVGQKYRIKYSIEYPEMFSILSKDELK
jgi:hypothetical protein